MPERPKAASLVSSQYGDLVAGTIGLGAGGASRASTAQPASSLRFPDDYLPLRSPAMAEVYRQLAAIAASDLPVLLLGETGVGKERLAQILHASSGRAGRPCVAVHCAAIPSELLESEMFGVEEGVATGVHRRQGRFEQAAGGTLFLDEVGEMPPLLQVKLLRALQEREVQPVGGRARKVDVRVVAATNADLRRDMEAGRFRRDLFYRLAGCVLEIPPLRRCREDIPVLVEQCLRRAVRESGRRICGLTAAALRRLEEHDWPGNVRELDHEVRRAVWLCPEGGTIDVGVVARVRGEALAAGDDPDDLALEPRLRELERRLLSAALDRAGGNKTRAAKLLAISRFGLIKKMRRYGLEA